ncbi:MAG TPA: RNA methyltransferase [Flavisolibacter sp.]|nr:RNA methyltransferase [Flavisolibacter sp.]
MLSKKEIKDIQSLGHKKFRDDSKLFVAEGTKIVNELIILIPHQLKCLYATPEWVKSNPVKQIEIKEITEAELTKISQLSTPNQVLAVINMFEVKEPVNPSFAIYLDTIQDPGNLGTIIRIADWFNIKYVVCSTGCADYYNPKAVQATMASLANVNVYYDKNGDWLSKQKLPVYAATLKGLSIYKTVATEKGILIIGNESKGISAEIMKYTMQQITIPKLGKAESLNASVATGIILSHIFKSV